MFKKQLLLASTTAAGIAVLSGYLGIARNQAQAAETQEVDLKFSGQVGDKPFNCGESYSNLGMAATTVTPTEISRLWQKLSVTIKQVAELLKKENLPE
ncbi:MAG: hypothetical protein WCD53_16270 [Microcoleus sp.]